MILQQNHITINTTLQKKKTKKIAGSMTEECSKQYLGWQNRGKIPVIAIILKLSKINIQCRIWRGLSPHLPFSLNKPWLIKQYNVTVLPCISLQHNSCLCSNRLLNLMKTHSVRAAASFTGSTRYKKKTSLSLTTGYIDHEECNTSGEFWEVVDLWYHLVRFL